MVNSKLTTASDKKVKFAIKLAEQWTTKNPNQLKGSATYMHEEMEKKYNSRALNCIVGDADKQGLFSRAIADTSIVFELEDIQYYLFQKGNGPAPKKR